MSDFVWVSTAPSDPTLAEGSMKTNLEGDARTRLTEAGRLAKTGEPVDPAVFPSEAWGDPGLTRSHQLPGVWPVLSFYNGFWIISGRFADILQRHDTGAGSLSPLRLFESDHTTPVAGEWSFWNIGNRKEAFEAASSTKVMPAPGNTFHIVGAQDHDLKCSASAAQGPEVWIDPRLRSTIFFSRRLGDALVEAGMTTREMGIGRLIACDLISIA